MAELHRMKGDLPRPSRLSRGPELPRGGEGWGSRGFLLTPSVCSSALRLSQPGQGWAASAPAEARGQRAGGWFPVSGWGSHAGLTGPPCIGHPARWGSRPGLSISSERLNLGPRPPLPLPVSRHSPEKTGWPSLAHLPSTSSLDPAPPGPKTKQRQHEGVHSHRPPSGPGGSVSGLSVLSPGPPSAQRPQ